MVNWILKLIPADYKWSVAVKNVAYDLGKAGAGLLMCAKAGAIEKAMHITVTPEMQSQVAAVIGALVTGGLAAFHDWAQVKWPNAGWL